VPAFNSFPDQLSQSHTLALRAGISQHSSRDEQFHEAMHIRMLYQQGPIEPVCFIVQAVPVVVASLRPAHFVTHYKHGQAEG
jgi:hypothetical protein